jgi:transposase
MAKTIQATTEARRKYRPLTKIMGLEDLDIVDESYDEKNNKQYFYCVARWEVALCPECLQISHKVHDYPKQRQIHDTPIRGKQVLLLFDSMR